MTPTVQAVAAFLNPLIPWIEQQLGTTYVDTITLAERTSPAEAAATDLFAGTTANSRDNASWRSYIRRWELPPGVGPRIELSRCRKRQPGKTPVNAWSVHWQECPIALSLKGFERPIIQINVPVSFPGDRSLRLEHCTWFIVRRQDAAKLLALFEDVIGSQGKYLHGIQGSMRLPACYNGDSLVLDDAVTQLLRRDFELFFERESWFRRWQNRAHFFGLAADLMRRLLIDHARAHNPSPRENREFCRDFEQNWATRSRANAVMEGVAADSR